MSETESPAALARRAIEILFVKKDVALARATPVWSESSVDHFLPLGISPRGPHEIGAFFTEFLTAVPDVHLELLHVVEAGNEVVIQWRMEGTFSGGPFQGIEPTGKRFSIRGVDNFVFAADGTMAENTVYYDGAEFARQIGLLPPRGSAADRTMLASFNAKTKLARRLRRRA